MSKYLIRILIVFCFFFSTVYAFDGLRDIKKYTEDTLNKVNTFIKDNELSTKQERPITESDDVIIVNKDRTIIYNGKKLVLGEHIDKWVEVLGKDYRILGFKNEYTKDKLVKESYIWDDLGIGLT